MARPAAAAILILAGPTKNHMVGLAKMITAGEHLNF
jgi:hypothetical protein